MKLSSAQFGMYLDPLVLPLFQRISSSQTNLQVEPSLCLFKWSTLENNLGHWSQENASLQCLLLYASSSHQLEKITFFADHK